MLPDWKFIAFQPPLKNSKPLHVGPVALDPEQLWINPQEKDGKLNLVLYFPEFEERYKSTYINAAYLLLDLTAGEYYSAMTINELQHHTLPDSPQEQGLVPFNQLQALVEQVKDKIHAPLAVAA